MGSVCLAGAVAVSGGVAWFVATQAATAEPTAQFEVPAPETSAAVYRAPTSEEIARLPRATFDAVIADLVPVTGTVSAPVRAGLIYRDIPLYGADRAEPVAVFPAIDAAGNRSVVTIIASDGPWSLVLTPARQALPSLTTGGAPAQSAAWVRTDEISDIRELHVWVEISVSDQRLTIHDGASEQSFEVGVGTSDTPTPTGVSGYLEARYLDAAQGQDRYRIQMTSLHATREDEPYRGSSGGVIGIHYSDERDGAVSHGCVRVGADAITALDALPLGTLITITE